jgi:hypothetical protein
MSWSWSWSSSCGRQTVDQFVWVSGLPLGPLTRFYLVLLFSADNYLIILSKASSLTRKRVCFLVRDDALERIIRIMSSSAVMFSIYVELLKGATYRCECCNCRIKLDTWELGRQRTLPRHVNKWDVLEQLVCGCYNLYSARSIFILPSVYLLSLLVNGSVNTFPR